MNLINKGDVLHCLISQFGIKPHYCVVVDYTINDKEELQTITVLPITKKIDPKDLCICYDCEENCSKIELTRNDTTKQFTYTSYIFLTKYIIPFSECDCATESVSYARYKITKSLRNKLKTFNIYV